MKNHLSVIVILCMSVLGVAEGCECSSDVNMGAITSLSTLIFGVLVAQRWHSGDTASATVSEVFPTRQGDDARVFFNPLTPKCRSPARNWTYCCITDETGRDLKPTAGDGGGVMGGNLFRSMCRKLLATR